MGLPLSQFADLRWWDGVRKSDDGFLVVCQADERGDRTAGYWQHFLAVSFSAFINSERAWAQHLSRSRARSQRLLALPGRGGRRPQRIA